MLQCAQLKWLGVYAYKVPAHTHTSNSLAHLMWEFRNVSQSPTRAFNKDYSRWNKQMNWTPNQPTSQPVSHFTLRMKSKLPNNNLLRRPLKSTIRHSICSTCNGAYHFHPASQPASQRHGTMKVECVWCWIVFFMQQLVLLLMLFVQILLLLPPFASHRIIFFVYDKVCFMENSNW